MEEEEGGNRSLQQEEEEAGSQEEPLRCPQVVEEVEEGGCPLQEEVEGGLTAGVSEGEKASSLLPEEEEQEEGPGPEEEVGGAQPWGEEEEQVEVGCFQSPERPVQVWVLERDRWPGLEILL